MGLRSYMGPVGTPTATHGRLVQGRQADNHPIVDRDDIYSGCQTDVVMAGVLMGPRAYAIEYAYDSSGERSTPRRRAWGCGGAPTPRRST